VTAAEAAATGFRVPFVIGYSGDAVPDPLAWRSRPGGLRLTYALPRRDDYGRDVPGCEVLRLRQNQKRIGRPDFTTVNTRRQWRCMTNRLCQVCAKSAVDKDTGRIWWLLASDGGESGDGFTNAPPTCKACIPEAITYCSHLRRHAAIFTVGDCFPYGVRADVFVPYLPPVVPFESNVVLRFDDYDMHHAVARELLMQLRDVHSIVHHGSIADQQTARISR
jgi:hypothetical protein